MIDNFAARMAEVVTSYSTGIKPGDFVVIRGTIEAEPLIDALTVAVLKRGGHPHPLVSLPHTTELMLTYGNDEQLQFVDPVMMALVEKVDVSLRVTAPSNPRNTAHIDPARIALHQQAIKPFMETYRRRRDNNELRWCICPWPTEAMAQAAEMGLIAYRQFVYEACGLDQDDPVAYWQAYRERQDRYVEWLNGKEQLVVRGPGIEMSMSITDRVWISADGTVNFPDGEIFTGPVEESVNGHVEFSFPTVYGGREVSGVRLVFKDGKVIEASADKGEDYLLSKLDSDPGARYLGEFAIGTNTGIQRFTGNTLFDEKIGGTIHMALGQAYKQTNAVNKSIVHWDMVHNMRDGGEIIVDGEVIYRSGEFLI